MEGDSANPNSCRLRKLAGCSSWASPTTESRNIERRLENFRSSYEIFLILLSCCSTSAQAIGLNHECELARARLREVSGRGSSGHKPGAHRGTNTRDAILCILGAEPVKPLQATSDTKGAVPLPTAQLAISTTPSPKRVDQGPPSLTLAQPQPVGR